MSETASLTRVAAPPLDDPRQLYCDLLKKTLTRHIVGEMWMPYHPRRRSLHGAIYHRGRHLLHRRGLELVRRFLFDAEAREHGRD